MIIIMLMIFDKSKHCTHVNKEVNEHPTKLFLCPSPMPSMVLLFRSGWNGLPDWQDNIIQRVSEFWIGLLWMREDNKLKIAKLQLPEHQKPYPLWKKYILQLTILNFNVPVCIGSPSENALARCHKHNLPRALLHK